MISCQNRKLNEAKESAQAVSEPRESVERRLMGTRSIKGHRGIHATEDLSASCLLQGFTMPCDTTHAAAKVKTGDALPPATLRGAYQVQVNFSLKRYSTDSHATW